MESFAVAAAAAADEAAEVAVAAVDDADVVDENTVAQGLPGGVAT